MYPVLLPSLANWRPVLLLLSHQTWVDGDSLGAVVRLVDTNQPVGQLKHVGPGIGGVQTINLISQVLS